jgi:hypothetical protein
LKTENVTAKFYDANGQEIQGTVEVISQNVSHLPRIRITGVPGVRLKVLLNCSIIFLIYLKALSEKSNCKKCLSLKPEDETLVGAVSKKSGGAVHLKLKMKAAVGSEVKTPEPVLSAAAEATPQAPFVTREDLIPKVDGVPTRGIGNPLTIKPQK